MKVYAELNDWHYSLIMSRHLEFVKMSQDKISMPFLQQSWYSFEQQFLVKHSIVQVQHSPYWQQSAPSDF